MTRKDFLKDMSRLEVATANEDSKRLYMSFETYPTNGLVPCAFADRVTYAQFLHDASEIEIVDGVMRLPPEKPNIALPVVECRVKP